MDFLTINFAVFLGSLFLQSRLLLLLIVLCQVALLANPSCVVWRVLVRAVGRLLWLPVLMVAIVAHI